jgi:hypothetical protein
VFLIEKPGGQGMLPTGSCRTSCATLAWWTDGKRKGNSFIKIVV